MTKDQYKRAQEIEAEVYNKRQGLAELERSKIWIKRDIYVATSAEAIEIMKRFITKDIENEIEKLLTEFNEL